jgi:hypothetical protein
VEGGFGLILKSFVKFYNGEDKIQFLRG